ncbi:MAG: hypothetical protein KKA73_16845 [Chloroflexi bacterium]|nr:hypothetical protein [Chloroflexota bacterium]MBU1749355.1 hypothetical protein [Chloroflexota bacterium]
MKKTTLGLLALLLIALLAAGCDAGPVPIITATPAINTRTPPQLSGKVMMVKKDDLWVLEGGVFNRLTHAGNLRQGRWSSDGQQIACVQVSQNGSDIVTLRPDGADFRLLTSYQAPQRADNHWAFRPTWSPASVSPAQIAYLSDAAGTRDLHLWLMSADGQGQHQIATAQGLFGGIIGLDWSPDGNTILLAAYRDKTSQIWRFDLGTSEWTPVTTEPNGAYDPIWSPDGQHIAYVVRRNGRHDIWVARPDGSEAAPITAAGTCRAPAWAPDGGMIAYLSNPTGYFDLWVADVTWGADGTATPSNHRQVTQGANLDPDSGLSWAR